MRILVANSIQAVERNASVNTWMERICDSLSQQGHKVDRFTLPFVHYLPSLLEQAMSFRLLDVSESADRLIVLDSPACLLHHPNKLVAITSSFDFFQGLQPTRQFIPDQERILSRMRRAIQVSLAEATAIAIESPEVKQKMQQHGMEMVGPYIDLNRIGSGREFAEELTLAHYEVSSVSFDGKWEEQAT